MYRIEGESVIFSKNNRLIYCQFFRTKREIPSDVNLYPTCETKKGIIVFVGNGHGVLKSHGLEGKCGKGSIHVALDQLPKELIDWCREQLKIKKQNRTHRNQI